MSSNSKDEANEYESLISSDHQSEFRPLQRNRRGPMMRVKKTSSYKKSKRNNRDYSKSLAYNSQSRGKRLNRFLTSQQDDRDNFTESAYSSSNSVSSASLFDPYAPVNLDELLHSEYELLSPTPRPESIFRIPRLFYKLLPTVNQTNRQVYIFFGGLFVVLSMIILTCISIPNVSYKTSIDKITVESTVKTSNGINEHDIHDITSKMEIYPKKETSIESKLNNITSTALSEKLRGDSSKGMDYSEDDMVLYSPKVEGGGILNDDYIFEEREGKNVTNAIRKNSEKKATKRPSQHRSKTQEKGGGDKIV